MRKHAFGITGTVIIHLVIRGNILLGFKLILRTSCPGIFKPLLVVDWVPARKLLKVNRVYIA